MAQVNPMAAAVQDASKTNADTVRQLAWLEHRCDSTTQAVERIHARSPSPEEDDSDMDERVITGKVRL
jgi:hypothetical protein